MVVALYEVFSGQQATQCRDVRIEWTDGRTDKRTEVAIYLAKNVSL